MKSILLSALLVLGLSTFTSGQELKIGYTNVEYIFIYWPEAQSAATELKEYETQLQVRLQAKVRTFQQELANYNDGVEMMLPEARTKKEEELQKLQVDIQQFEVDAQQSIATKNAQLQEPLYEKLQTVIDEVATENGFSLIMTSESLLFIDENLITDVSNLLFAKLGVEPPSID